MGTYFNPPTREAVEAAGGRQLSGDSFAELVSKLSEGEILTGLYSRRDLGFCSAPHLYNKEDLMSFTNKSAGK